MSLRVGSRVNLKAFTSRRAVLARAEDEVTSLTTTSRVGGKLFFPDKASAEYLDGTYAGDLGFDPLGLLDPEGAGGFISPEWLRYGEIINGRWAMLGCAGCIAPEFLGKAGLIPEATNVIWWKSGVIPPVGTPDGLYWADPWAIFFIEVVLMQFAELRRWQDYKNPGSMGEQYFLGLEGLLKGSGEPAYPGGPFFNFAGMGKTDEEVKELRTKELQNGRLAMISIFGYGAQAIITGKGPIDNILDHLADPTGNNILTSFGKIGGV